LLAITTFSAIGLTSMLISLASAGRGQTAAPETARRLSSEWEGHAYTDEWSGFEMVEKHQALCRRLWNASSRLRQ
jgi:hypothetical protein